jgi:hypothetical protein
MDLYYNKYIKYKIKYLKLKKIIGGEAHYGIIKKGEILFRAAPQICNYKTEELCMENAMYCKDTAKTGIYFSNTPIISIAMCLEYNRLLEIGVFEVLEDIKALSDKYEHREINPSRYFDNGKFIPYVEILPEENLSHFMCPLNLLKRNKLTNQIELLLFKEKQDELDRKPGCEVFLTNDDIKKIRLIDSFKFNDNKIKNDDELLLYMENNNYPFHLDKYIEDEVLIKFSCS